MINTFVEFAQALDDGDTIEYMAGLSEWSVHNNPDLINSDDFKDERNQFRIKLKPKTITCYMYRGNDCCFYVNSSNNFPKYWDLVKTWEEEIPS
jgi:hypothetical protein